MKNIKKFFLLASSNIKWRLIRYLYFSFKGWKSPRRSGRILIARLDGIGDYVLFRNFIGVLKTSSRFSGHRITLLGNVVFRDLAEGFDKNLIDEFVWVDLSRLQDGRYYALLALRLKMRGFDLMINPVHSRMDWQDQFLLDLGCKFSIASSGDDFFYSDSASKMSNDARYDEIVLAIDYRRFEFERNRFFVKALTNASSDVALSLDYGACPCLRASFFNVALVPGAGAPFRRWAASNFISLVTEIGMSVLVPIQFYIVGSRDDQHIASEILLGCKGIASIEDLTGKTRLDELTNLIGNADLVISNETSAIHIAAATDTPAICISNGNHFGRFNPYPREMNKRIITLYPERCFSAAIDRDRLVDRYRYRSDLDINLVSVDAVLKETKRIIYASTNSKASTSVI